MSVYGEGTEECVWLKPTPCADAYEGQHDEESYAADIRRDAATVSFAIKLNRVANRRVIVDEQAASGLPRLWLPHRERTGPDTDEHGDR